MNSFSIENRRIGPQYPPLVVAEIGINHGGSLEVALQLAKLAIDSGVEVVKHQTHIPDAEMSIEAKSVIPGNASVSIYDVISSNCLTLDEEVVLAEYVRSRGIIYLSTPFSIEAVDFLEDLKVPAYKIGSGECNNYPFVEYVASKGKPVILSTGMNTIESITPSVEILRKSNVDFALLHCTNLYPTPNTLIRLNALSQIREAFPDSVVGLSDHSLTNYPCLGSVALGASILERHFTDSKERSGPDIVCSMTPFELSSLIEGTRTIWESMLGGKFPVAEESVTEAFAFSSVDANQNLEIGAVLNRANTRLKRPSGGDFGPKDYDQLLGSVVKIPLFANQQIPRASISLVNS